MTDFTQTVWTPTDKVDDSRLSIMSDNDEVTKNLSIVNPKGILAKTLITSDITVTGTSTLATVTTTVGKNRNIMACLSCKYLTRQGAQPQVRYFLAIDGTTDPRSYFYLSLQDGELSLIDAQTTFFSYLVVPTLVSGSHTFTFKVITFNANGFYFKADAAVPAVAWIEDLGAERQYV